MQVITLDFETYYSTDYGLGARRCTTEEYIRHEQFEVIGVSVKVDDGPTEWFSGTKQNTQKFLDKFDWANAIGVAHNAMFDMAILNWHFDIRPRKIVDTLSMARALHTGEVGGSLAALTTHYGLGTKGKEVLEAINKTRIDFSAEDLAAYGSYCINDTELTYQLFLILAKGFPVIELQLIDLTMRMFTEPAIQLDKQLLDNHLTEIADHKKSLMLRIEHDQKELMSNPKFAALLESYGVTPPKKISPTTGKETYAFAKTDEGLKLLQDHNNIEVQNLVSARLGVKSTLEEKRTQRFIDIAERGLLPVPLKYYAAHTGRWGGDGKINMQNLPRGSLLKKALLAPEGYRFIDCDLSQIEARVLAWLANQINLVGDFDSGADVYKIMASAIYNKSTEDVTKEERFVGKQTVLGCGYGMGAVRFQAQLQSMGVALSQGDCQHIIQTYRTSFPAIREFWHRSGDALAAIISNTQMPLGCPELLVVEGQKGIRLPNNLYLRYPNLRSEINPDTGRGEFLYDTLRGKSRVPTRIYGGKVVENICQAVARIVIGEQLVNVSKEYKVVMTVHDAIACLVPEQEVEIGMKRIEEIMKVRPSWAPELPLDCEGGFGVSYGECG
jgi:DNA polymerase I-like protein with 3'-5' exonuclease and polymerase domains